VPEETGEDQAPPRRGRLDGLTILRFARAYEHGGGVEGHLADLNRELGRRNRLTTIQLQLTAEAARLEPTDHAVGVSRLLTVPLLEGQASAAEAWAPEFKARTLDALLPTAHVNAVAMRQLSRIRAVPRRAGCAIGAGTTTAALFERHPIDLVVLHACGGADASEIIDVAAARRVPVAIVHHFSNHRLSDVSVRQQVSRVQAVAGASAVDVPRYLRDTFRNLSDGVDTAFYDRARAGRIEAPGPRPVIFAPGRLTPEKGQLAALEVARRLKRSGVAATVVFAGRADDAAFEAELRRRVLDRDLTDDVVFLGALSLATYRDWYCAAAVTLMPTLHAEGMPRTLVESQAMQVPPVVYDVGGTSEGVRHGETGFLVRAGDLDALTATTAQVLGDADLRQRMGRAGRTFVERQFSLEALAMRHEQFYLDLLSPRA